MTLFDIFNLIVALVFFISGFFGIFMVFYLTRKHIKIMDKIVYNHEFTDDNFILQSMRISQYLVLIFVSRTRQRWPENIQEKIVGLDSKFRRPFKILIISFIVYCTSILLSVILEKF